MDNTFLQSNRGGFKMTTETYENFLKEQELNKKWKFDLFKIRCCKCNSEEVEFNSDMEKEYGYYGDCSVEGQIIVKCHSCGNAFTLDFWELEK